MIHWDQDDDGIVTLTIDDTGRRVNLVNRAFAASLRGVVERLVAEQDALRGVIITSAKPSFCAGLDFRDVYAATQADVERLMAENVALKADLRRLETLPIPVVAALGGTALAAGFEIALAAHHRIIVDGPGVTVGLPQVKFGLLPGLGGVTRCVRMFGAYTAIADVLLPGAPLSAAAAAKRGLVDEVVGSHEELMAAARAWIDANPSPAKPWDTKAYRIPGGTAADPAVAAKLSVITAALRKQLGGCELPAPPAIVAAGVEGTLVDFDTASAVETRYWASLVTHQVTKNLISALVFDSRAIVKGGSRPADFDVTSFEKVAVLGAGMMGAGIAYVQARAGMQVVLKDISVEAAEKGKSYTRNLLDKGVARGTLTPDERDEVLARITATDSYDDCAGCDLVIEAVFEDPELKKRVFAGAEASLPDVALLASNTSTLPITDLATGVSRPEDFIGLHFFSPVDKMALVEIVVGAKTSDAALAKAVDYVLAIGKTPIVVNDSRGFFTSRVIGTFVDEAMAMVGEGVEPASIEQAGLRAGYPSAPLQLMDEITIALPLRAREITRAETEAAGGMFRENGAGPVMVKMVRELERPGRSSGGGFYEYAEDGRRVGIWSGLRAVFDSGSASYPLEDMTERMLFAEALETVRCLDEGVLRTIPDANVGSILGIGFPAWTGGVIQYINSYPGGLPGFIARAEELAARYGSRFTPPAPLVDAASRGEIQVALG